MKTILVPTDFSQAALSALNYAADFAMAIHADLFLLHIYQRVAYGELPIPTNSEDICQDYQKELDALKKHISLRSAGNLNIETEVRTSITFHHELKAACENIRPYAVVMGSQGFNCSRTFGFWWPYIICYETPGVAINNCTCKCNLFIYQENWNGLRSKQSDRYCSP